MMSPESDVMEKLIAINFPGHRTHVMRGWVEESLARSDAPKKVAFAYVDFDFYDPIKTALEYLDRVMPVGGRIVVDDYGFFPRGRKKPSMISFALETRAFLLSTPLPFAGKFVVLERVALT